MCPWARRLTLTAPDEMAVALHGWVNVCINRCKSLWIKASAKCPNCKGLISLLLLYLFIVLRKRGKKGEKNGKGLRHFSMKVCEKVQKKGVTTYNEVADELVAEFSSADNHMSPNDSVRSVAAPQMALQKEKNRNRSKTVICFPINEKQLKVFVLFSFFSWHFLIL